MLRKQTKSRNTASVSALHNIGVCEKLLPKNDIKKHFFLLYTHYIKLSLLLRWINSQLMKQELILQLTVHSTAVNQD